MPLEVLDQRIQQVRDIIVRDSEASKLYKVTIVVDLGRNPQRVWFVAYLRNMKSDPNIVTYTGIWGCKSTGVKFNRANPDPTMRKLNSRKYWSDLALDILDTYLNESPETYRGSRPTRFERLLSDL